MKLRILTFLILMLLSVGCSNNTNSNLTKPSNANVKNEITTVSNFFPLQKDLTYIYQDDNGDLRTMTTEYVKGRIAQLNTKSNSIALTEKVIVGQGAIKKLMLSSDNYYRDNLLDKQGSEEILLKQPIKAGTEWETKGKHSRIAAIDVLVRVPSGEYRTVKVVTETKEGVINRYFAKDIGIVKEERIAKNTSTTELKQFFKAPENKLIKMYFPNTTLENVTYKEKEIKLHTNDNLAQIIFEALKAPIDADMLPAVPKNAKLISFNLENRLVRLDFNSEFLRMNVGSQEESLYLEAIDNTFKEAYGAEGVILNIEGKAYESGHFSFGKDDVLKVR